MTLTEFCKQLHSTVEQLLAMESLALRDNPECVVVDISLDTSSGWGFDVWIVEVVARNSVHSNQRWLFPLCLNEHGTPVLATSRLLHAFA